MSRNRRVAHAVWAAAFLFAAAESVWAHCDTMDGPVVKDAQAALRQGDVTPVLKWVQADHEAEVRDAFEQALAARQQDQQADTRFFETLVRLHRLGEGVEFTSLKPAGALEPPFIESDAALETGSADRAIELVTREVRDGIQRRFAAAWEAKQHANDSVEAGRAYVAAYVEFMHYVEGLYATAGAAAAHHASGQAGESHHAVSQPGAAHHAGAHAEVHQANSETGDDHPDVPAGVGGLPHHRH